MISLEKFVGEKERKSLDPLLATPLTNTQLYLGKMLASVIPPLFASYLGISVYLVGLALTTGWTPHFQLFLQSFIITTVQAVVMVAGADVSDVPDACGFRRGLGSDLIDCLRSIVWHVIASLILAGRDIHARG